MKTPTWLLALLIAPRLSPRTRLGPEAKICLELAARLRVASLEGKFNGVWLHIPNEGKRSYAAAGLMRAMGLIAGAPDYLFANTGGALFIEMKSATGAMNENQRHYASWCAAQRIPHVIARSADEAWTALQLHKFV